MKAKIEYPAHVKPIVLPLLHPQQQREPIVAGTVVAETVAAETVTTTTTTTAAVATNTAVQVNAAQVTSDHVPWLTELSQMHQAFLAQQLELHKRNVALQQRLWATAFAAPTPLTSSPVTPTPLASPL